MAAEDPRSDPDQLLLRHGPPERGSAKQLDGLTARDQAVLATSEIVERTHSNIIYVFNLSLDKSC
jgi:hypothetical protein